MRTAICALSVCVLCLSFRLVAQTPDQQPVKPGPEQKRLEVFLGKWINQGEAKASAYGPAGRITAAETFEWLPGGFFMIHRSEGRQGTNEVNWIEILGYDIRKKIYTTHTFDNFGNSALWQGRWNGNTLTWTADSYVAAKSLKERCAIDVSSPEKLYVKCENSTDGGSHWQPTLQTTLTRAK